MSLRAAAAIELRVDPAKKRRCPIQTLSSMLVLYLLFVGLFYNARRARERGLLGHY